jgi:hypothetical protein
VVLTAGRGGTGGSPTPKRGDRWNSTKDTAMILFAMCDYLAKMEYDPSTKASLGYRIKGPPGGRGAL